MIEFKKTVAVLGSECAIEEAETLLGWLIEHREGRVNLKAVEQPHTAVMQVLMAAKPGVSVWPSNPDVSAWMRPMLAHEVTN